MDTSSSTPTDPLSSSSTNGSDTSHNSSAINNGGRSRYGLQFLQLPTALNFVQSPLSVILEQSGIIPRATEAALSSHRQESEQRPMVSVDSEAHAQNLQMETLNSSSNPGANSTGEVSIQIVRQESGETETTGAVLENQENSDVEERTPLVSPSSSSSLSSSSLESNSNSGSRDEMSYQSQRYDIQQFARWVEQVLPFSLLLLVVFVRQHLQGIIIIIIFLIIMHFIAVRIIIFLC